MAINLKQPWNIGWNGGGDFNQCRGYLAELLLTCFSPILACPGANNTSDWKINLSPTICTSDLSFSTSRTRPKNSDLKFCNSWNLVCQRIIQLFAKIGDSNFIFDSFFFLSSSNPRSLVSSACNVSMAVVNSSTSRLAFCCQIFSSVSFWLVVSIVRFASASLFSSSASRACCAFVFVSIACASWSSDISSLSDNA